MQNNDKLSKFDIVIPCYNEQENVIHFYNEIEKIKSSIINVDFNYIYIDDGSCDNTLDSIKNLTNKYENVSYISFSRNFGKEAAIFAGLEKSKMDYVFVMDVDMQDPPRLLNDMICAIINEGYDACGTYRKNRKGEPILRSFFANLFYYLIKKMSNVYIPNGCRDFCLMKKYFKDTLLEYKEKNRFFKGLFCSIGYKIKWIGFDNQNRYAGKSKWSFVKLFAYSIEAIMSFSNVPLIISSIVGLIFCAISFLAMVFIIIRALMFGDKVAGWPSMITIILFLFGLMYLFIGIIGLYISKNYIEIKNRPLYIIKEEK